MVSVVKEEVVCWEKVSVCVGTFRCHRVVEVDCFEPVEHTVLPVGNGGVGSHTYGGAGVGKMYVVLVTVRSPVEVGHDAVPMMVKGTSECAKVMPDEGGIEVVAVWHVKRDASASDDSGKEDVIERLAGIAPSASDVCHEDTCLITAMLNHVFGVSVDRSVRCGECAMVEVTVSRTL